MISVFNNLGWGEDVIRAVPSTRLKGQIACYSCFAKNRPNSGKINGSRNFTAISALGKRVGFNLPVFADRCADTLPSHSPNFFGAQIHFCPNTKKHPGSCVKLKLQHGGEFNPCLYMKSKNSGETYVIRDCWSQLWRQKRAFKHAFSGMCLSDAFVHSLFESEQSSLCFCEGKLFLQAQT